MQFCAGSRHSMTQLPQSRRRSRSARCLSSLFPSLEDLPDMLSKLEYLYETAPRESF